MINYKEELNQNQYDAVTHMDGPMLLVAGAGAGKTRVLTYRVAHLIENDVAPESILLLTFTNAAADEMRERAKKLLDERCDKITACTYHSFCAQVLRIHAKIVGIQSNFSILSPSQVNDAISYVKANQEKKYKLKGFPNSANVAGMYSSCINRQMTLEEVIAEFYPKYTYYKDLITELIEEYKTYKIDNNLVDYDDLLVYMDKLLDDNRVNKILENRYRYIMIDEYQDTNNLQESIVIKLRKHCNNIVVVGDDYQSIYRFRGANVSNFTDFPKQFSGCQIKYLMENYRSTPDIIQFANTVMAENAHFGMPKNMKPGKEWSNTEPVDLWRGYNQDAQKAFIKREINKLRAKGVSYDDIAIIERNSNSSFSLEIDLTADNINYIKRGGLKLLERNCVLNMIAYLNVIVNPDNALSWFRILCLHEGIGETYARKIAESSSSNINGLLENNFKSRKFYKELIVLDKFITDIRAIDDFMGQYKTIAKFYYDLRKRIILNAKMEEETRQDLLVALEEEKQILEELRVIIDGKYNTISKFLDAIMLDGINKLEENDSGVLTITTIHSSKGLEWDYVFVIDCSDDELTAADKSSWYDEDDNEELRCFYVAITRAKKKLYICSPESGIIRGQFQYLSEKHYLLDKNHQLIKDLRTIH